MTAHSDPMESLFAGRRLFNRAQWILFVLTAMLTAAYLAWLALAQVSFLYPLWHDLVGIDHTIEIYGPQNRYKQGFERTTEAERSRLFAAIVEAIHNQGEGLRELVYHDAAGRPLDTLLREPEILHLQDVARLIDALTPVGVGASVMAIILLVAIRLQRLPMPSLTSLILGVLVPLGMIAVAVLIIGPVTVFYWLHMLIFPPGHDWFFYYQDSLMSTMMQAPDLFGHIATVWVVLTLLLLALLIAAAKRLSRSNRSSIPRQPSVV